MNGETAKLVRRLDGQMISASKKADKYRESASNLAAAAWTRRRSEMSRGAMSNAHFMDRVSRALGALANAHRDGNVPPCLARIGTSAAVRDLLMFPTMSSPEWDTYARMMRVGINESNYEQARAWLIDHAEAEPPDLAQKRIQYELEMRAKALIGRIPGFFPTPPDIVQLMIELAELGPTDRVLDPSAGAGHILDQLDGGPMFGIERDRSLCEILSAKGLPHKCDDFMTVRGKGEYDVVLMNPPFEKGQDVRHVQHAMEFVRHVRGRVVAVVSESCFYRQDNAYAAFRDLLAAQQYDEIDLPAGAFKGSGTNVKARIVALWG